MHTLDELFEFARAGNVEAIQSNLDNPLLRHADEAGWTVLHIAASTGSVPLLRLLLNTPAAVFPNANIKTKQGVTPLHYAASRGHLPATLFLLSTQPAPQHTQDLQSGWTPMHRAAAGNHQQVLLELVNEFPLDKDIKDVEGNTALHVAVQERAVGCVRVLVEAGCAIGVVNKEGKVARDYVPLGDHDFLALLPVQ